MKTQLYFMTLLACFNVATGFDQIIMFNETKPESQWQYIEKVFITDIAAAKDALWQNVYTAIPSMVFAGSAASFATQKDDQVHIKSLLTAKNVYSTCMV